jgi:hypothetical protein
MEVTPYETLIKQEGALSLQLKVVRDYIKAFYPDKLTLEEQEIESLKNHFESMEEIQKWERAQQNQPKTRTIRKKVVKKGKTKISIPAKVLKALETIGQGKTKDVAAKMVELFPEYQKNPDKAIADARFHISAMKNKQVEVVEEGIGNSGSTYKLITAA